MVVFGLEINPLLGYVVFKAKKKLQSKRQREVIGIAFS